MLTEFDRKQLREYSDPFEEVKVKKNKDIGLLRQLALRVVTFLQEASLKQDNIDLYYKLTKLHFRLFFGKMLVNEAVSNSFEFRAVQERHVAMVMLLVLGVSKKNKKLESAIGQTFQKNLLLEARV